jgi:hypothetical protein
MSESKIEKLAEVQTDFFNAIEAAAVSAKREIAEIFEGKGVPNTTELPGSEKLVELPFISYKTKETAKEKEAGWIFANTKGAEALLATLKSKDGKARVGNFDYQLQGKEKQFISRKPMKK